MSAPARALPARTPRSPWAIVRGAAAVAVLIAGAVDALVSAWLGIPRLGWLARRAAAACADEYRRAAWGAADAEVIADVEVIDGHDGGGIDGPGAAGDDTEGGQP